MVRKTVGNDIYKNHGSRLSSSEFLQGRISDKKSKRKQLNRNINISGTDDNVIFTFSY